MAAERASRGLAARITKAASRQSYLTIRWLADSERRGEAFAIYAYFRWLDDTIDDLLGDTASRLTFVARQRGILAAARDDAAAPDPRSDAWSPWLPLAPEETLLVDLAHASADVSDGEALAPGSAARPRPRLSLALDAMLDLMDIDATRRGQAITAAELEHYTHTLAVAVSESLHHCIGHDSAAAAGDTRYAAVKGAHVAHMLRDLREDLDLGFYNLPGELLDAHEPAATDVHADAMRDWVRQRVDLARAYFVEGRAALDKAEHWRCRLAGHAYIARFEWILDAIEADDYRLRRAYPERATMRGGVKILADGIGSARRARRSRRTSEILADSATRRPTDHSEVSG